VRQDLRRWLDELHKELGVTSLLVTHDQEEALELANQIVVMHEGHMEQVGSPTEIYDEPSTPFVAGFVGSANVLHGHVEAGQMLRVDGAEHLSEGEPATAYVRPHDVHVSVDSNGGEAKATVARRTMLGWLSQLTLLLTNGETIVAHVPNQEIEGVKEGDTVWVDLRNPKAFARREGEPVGGLTAEPVNW